MKRVIRVFMGEEGRLVGTLRFAAKGARESSAFQYDPAWLDGGFPLDPALTLVAGNQFPRRTPGGSVFHPAIADTEPDGWARRVILRDHAKRRQDTRKRGASVVAQKLDALDFLLSVDDVSRVGALRFQDEDGVFRRATQKGGRGVPPLMELGRLLAATRAVENNEETSADLEYLLGRGTSVGGLRPKCSLIDVDGRLSIAKFPSVGDERSVTMGEVLAARLAREAGIDAVNARVVQSGGVSVCVVRRFDRAPAGGRLMYVSAATMIGADRSGTAEHSYTEIVDALRLHGVAAQADIEELWRRIAFTILITNVDDHLLNHGFLHADRGLWRLSPAFDVNPFPDRHRELKTWISEDTGPQATIDALLSVTPYFRISRRRAAEILQVAERAASRWRTVGRAIGMTAVELDQFADAFEHEERGAARRAARSRAMTAGSPRRGRATRRRRGSPAAGGGAGSLARRGGAGIRHTRRD